jgi:hypothetical protein
MEDTEEITRGRAPTRLRYNKRCSRRPVEGSSLRSQLFDPVAAERKRWADQRGK